MLYTFANIGKAIIWAAIYVLCSIVVIVLMSGDTENRVYWVAGLVIVVALIIMGVRL